MEKRKDNLTIEKLRQKFTSQFELVGHAIKLVENMVQSGRAPRVYTEDQNLAVIALDEMSQGKDFLESLPDDVMLVAKGPVLAAAVIEAEAPPHVEKKKTRRIL